MSALIAYTFDLLPVVIEVLVTVIISDICDVTGCIRLTKGTELIAMTIATTSEITAGLNGTGNKLALLVLATGETLSNLLILWLLLWLFSLDLGPFSVHFIF